MKSIVNLLLGTGCCRVYRNILLASLAPILPIQAVDTLIPNGVSDVWEVACGMHNPTGETDSDGDGRSDLDEAREATDPHDPESCFVLKTLKNQEDTGLITWYAMLDRRYIVQSAVNGGEWVNISDELIGNNAEAALSLPAEPSGNVVYRVVATMERSLPAYAEAFLSNRDTDSDSQNDWIEWVSGSSVIDPASMFTANITSNVSTLNLTWSTQKGIVYNLEIWQEGEWQSYSGPFDGTGHAVIYAVPADAQIGIFRLQMSMPDEDEDGLTDWEECILGLELLDQYTVSPLIDDLTYVQDNLLTGGKLVLETVKPTIRGATERAVVRVRRTGGLAPLEVNLSVAGDWALASTEPVIFGLGVDAVELELVATPGSSPGYLALLGDEDYTLGNSTVRSFVFMGESLINVKDHGAVGDGIIDDSAALQLAIEALEDDGSKDGLFFPSGKYRLTTITPDFDSPYGWKRILELGYRVDLAGRDILLKGEPGACLYSEVGSVRVNLLNIKAGFRSLAIEGLRIEQDSEPLAETSLEPNFSDGITISADGLRKIEGVYIKNCEFVNCHRAISVYGAGYDLRGKGGCFSMINCQVINPYGSNTAGGTGWGGGQQLYIAPWVAEAHYENCVFDGGASDMTDSTTTPGGRVKDGCHFGSPLRLVFRNNTVLRMGVEAVHQTNEASLMARTNEAFLMPPADDITTVAVEVTMTQSTWVSGESVNIRTPGTPTSTESNNRLTIRGFDPVTRKVLFSNPGTLGNIPEGSTFTRRRAIYLDERSEPTTAIFQNNYFDGAMPPGGKAFKEQAAIVFQADARICNNVVLGHGNGIFSRSEAHTPKYSSPAGALIRGNLIVTRRSQDFQDVYTYGINVAGGREKIQDNLVICPVSWKTAGIAVQLEKTWIWRNTVLADEILINGYYSSNRTTGIGNGYNAPKMWAWENHTRGFDLGVGCLGSAAWPGHKCCDHTSILDVVAIQKTNREPCDEHE